eukprot:TRINITY_DN4606_c0_g1_i2.p1 TRINITY_DN4606_c0_g1~~TRINITY_DN4606_c0_g1_i2.p1  ORF type:complete len:641 (+),score=107.44 TRINITY_DN4606_c0_g1_i2:360-2282(+)
MRAHRSKRNDAHGRPGKSAPRMVPVHHGVVSEGNKRVTLSPTGSYPPQANNHHKTSSPRDIPNGQQPKRKKSSPPLPASAGHHHHLPHSPHQLGETKNRPVWVNDYAAHACHKCKAPFTFFFRRHHCRGCGLVFCQACTNQQCVLPHMGYTDSPVRVCLECFKKRDTLGMKQKKSKKSKQSQPTQISGTKRGHSGAAIDKHNGNAPDNSGSSGSDEEKKRKRHMVSSPGSTPEQPSLNKGDLAFKLADAIARGDIDRLAQIVIDSRIAYGSSFNLNSLRVGMCEGEGPDAVVEEVTLLDVAARSLTPACPRMLQILVSEQGMDPSIPVNSKGDTPIIVAASAGNLEALEYFLQKVPELGSASDVYRKNMAGETALHVACGTLVKRIYPGHEGVVEGAAAIDVVKALWDRRFDCDAVDSLGRTPLHAAVAHNVWHPNEHIDPEIVHFLLQAGANVNAIDYKGRTPLHLAAALSHHKIVKCLLNAKGVDVNLRDAQGNTALHLAVFPLSLIAGLGTSPGMDELVNEEATAATLSHLLAAHADISLPNNAGRTPLQVAACEQWKHMLLQSVSESSMETSPPESLSESSAHDGHHSNSSNSSNNTNTNTNTGVPPYYYSSDAGGGAARGGVCPPSSHALPHTVY